MFTISKKISKLDSSNAFKSMIGAFMSPQSNAQAATGNVNVPNLRNLPNLPNAQNMQSYQNAQTSETTEDMGDSKLKGVDGIDIDNILKTMNERKREKETVYVGNVPQETSDEVFKSIPLNTQKRGRGRPRKGVVMKA